MKVYQLNDYEWWMANSLEEAIATAMKDTGCDREDVVPEEEEAYELSDEELNKMKFVVDTDAPEEDRTVRTFREELDRRIAEGCGPELFATTEW